MTAAKIAPFGGMQPAIDDTLLPSTAAAFAQNTWLYGGVARGINSPTLLRACTLSGCAKVYRIPNNFTDFQHLPDADWLEFADINTDVVRSMVLGETFDRYYWANTIGPPMYNTRARIKAGSPAYLLGIPTPSAAPGVTHTGGVSSVVATRAYVYTWVSQYGEEGAPSPATTVSGKQDDTWTVTLTLPGTGDTDQRALQSVRIYRTVTAATGQATFQLIATLPIATTSFSDTVTDTVASGNAQLAATSWTPPPNDLQGWAAMPNGIIAGFRANEVWFCEQFRPHAWPAAYTLTVDYPIVGMGVIGQTLVVCTAGYPATVTGSTPASMTQSKLAAFEPCMSRGSIVSAPEGVYYASPNGLVVCDGSTATNITRPLITKDKWQNLLPCLPTLRAVRLGSSYYGFGSSRPGVFDTGSFDTGSFAQTDFTGSFNGFLIDSANPQLGLTLLSNPVPAVNTVNDAWSGEVFIIRNNNVYWVNIQDPAPISEVYLWRSKKFETTRKDNFGVMRIYFDVPATAPTQGTRNVSFPQLSPIGDNQYGVVRLYADDKLVMTKELWRSGEMMRLPSGFKADYWQVEIEARVSLRNLQLATTAKELASV